MDTNASSRPPRHAPLHGRRYGFGDFLLDEGTLSLTCLGQPLSVQPKVLRTLLYLVAERARVVTPDDLFRALWPAERVGAASITRAIIGVRRALGEVGHAQTSVRTLRGLGYQFVRAVRVVSLPTLEGGFRACSSYVQEPDVGALPYAVCRPNNASLRGGDGAWSATAQ